MPDGCDIIPPRLGEVGLFVLSLHNESKFECPTPRGLDDNLKDHITNSANSPHETIQVPPSQLVFADTKTLTFLKSLRVAARIIAALLLLTLIKILSLRCDNGQCMRPGGQSGQPSQPAIQIEK